MCEELLNKRNEDGIQVGGYVDGGARMRRNYWTTRCVQFVDLRKHIKIGSLRAWVDKVLGSSRKILLDEVFNRYLLTFS